MLVPLDLKDRVLDVQASRHGGIRTDVGFRFGALEVFILDGLCPFAVATPDGKLRAQFISPLDAVIYARNHHADHALPLPIDELKRCARCGRLKHPSAFSKDSTRADGRYHTCRDCRRPWDRQRKRAARGRALDLRRRLKGARA